ncbi:MAG: cation diffusion facilitator family transporter [Faecalibacterium sp.]|nr:cation diffusion facilitator family transporter [Ruminococcus sp.]MCM1392298.1 cation diffusion facilitator family transporter [Ruminococcus sp.]MCM1484710.1 cation diffusion facilitator family transporter [Faecalibacterium sp.]
MSGLIVRIFIKDYTNIKSPLVREKYGLLSGLAGLLVNIILTVCKFIIGALTRSIAITADAINNLSDAGSCIVTLVGFKMSSAKPDKEHPFGHGRVEYIAALVIGFIVELMGFELIKTSVDKIANPHPLFFNIPAVVILVLSIGGKLWLALFNRYLGKQIESPALTAAVKDSISDITATSVTLISLLLSKVTSLPVDGIFGIVVALFIMYSGFGILRETVSFLLGKPPSKDIVNDIICFIRKYDGVLGTHDLIIHSYGANNSFASVHVEVSSDMNLVEAHEKIDTIEKAVLKKFGIMLVAHLDPIVVNDENVNNLRQMMQNIIDKIDCDLSMHDFRVNETSNQTKLIFDLVIPYDYKYTKSQLISILDNEVKNQNDKCVIVPTIESELS